MSDLSPNYTSGLAAAMLDSGAIRIGYAEDGSGVKVDVDANVMGMPGSQLWDVAAYGYANTLRESGLLMPGDERTGVFTFANMQPFVGRVLREVLDREWQWAEDQPRVEEIDLVTPDLTPAVMFDGSLDMASVELAKIANRYGQIVGMIALLDMQRGVQSALRNEAGVDNVHSVLKLEDVIRYAMAVEHGPVSKRDYVRALLQLGNQEYP